MSGGRLDMLHFVYQLYVHLQLRMPRGCLCQFVEDGRCDAQAFSNMMIDEQRQAILISGESGAGKTESAKMVCSEKYCSCETRTAAQAQTALVTQALASPDRQSCVLPSAL